MTSNTTSFTAIKIIRRSLFAILVFITTMSSIFLINQSFFADQSSLLKFIILTLSGILNVELSISFWNTLIGFFVILQKKQPPITNLSNISSQLPRSLNVKTAIVMPICNEDPQQIFVSLQAIFASLMESKQEGFFDLFILSDTTHPKLQQEEEQYWQKMQLIFNAHDKIKYRHRDKNIGKKSGNIIDFCERWGSQYEYMIVLDADSLMSAKTLSKLVNLMVAQPRIAIVQTLTLIFNQTTLFGRIMQFSHSIYVPTNVTGTAFWQLSESQYFGHNAIIRLQPFLQHCKLPKLPGKQPLGGEILSHDLVEAALLRDAGWKVWSACDVKDSYEELPPTLIDYAKRDRRWCQGNIQHFWFLLNKKFSLTSRVYFFLEILNYLIAPLWLLFIVLNGLAAYRYHVTNIIHSITGSSTSILPISHSLERIFLLSMTIGMLFLPKFLSLLLILFNPQQTKQYGGFFKLSISAILEWIFSILFVPILMVYRTKFILAILFQYNIGWTTQRRKNSCLSFKEACRAHFFETLLGLISVIAIYHFIHSFFWWFLIAILGLIVAIPFSILLSSTKWGQWTKHWQLFCTPLEIQPPRIIALYSLYMSTYENNLQEPNKLLSNLQVMR